MTPEMMTPEIWQKVSEAFDRAESLELEARQEYLANLRREAPVVGAEVERLLGEGNHESTIADSPEMARERFVRALDSLVTPAAPDQEVEATRTDCPTQVGRYRIVGKLGSGGMGTVLRAEDPQLHRSVAIKILLQQHQTNPELLRRFEEEALLTAQLQHPGIPSVHELGTTEDGRPFLAMKLIQGITFADKLDSRPSLSVNFADLLADFEQVCQTVAYAHAHRVIHRDLKPHNIMVGKFGEVQVMDWGLAKMLSTPSGSDTSWAEQSDFYNPRVVNPEETTTGAILGTRAYMPPEQARGEIPQLDERSDVFALGAILCVLLTGAPPHRLTLEPTDDPNEPHQRARIREWIRRTEAGDLDDAFARLAECERQEPSSKPLVELARTCLAPEKNARPEDAGQVAEAIAKYRADLRERERTAELERARTTVKLEEERKRSQAERHKRRAMVAFLVVLLLLLASGGGAFLWYQSQRSAAERRHAVTEERISDALDQARTFRNDLHSQLGKPGGVFGLLNQPAQWEATIESARQALQRAELLQTNAESDVTPELHRRIDSLRADVQNDLEDFRFAKALEEIRERRAAFEDPLGVTRIAAKEYGELFQRVDLIPSEGTEEVIAKRIGQSPIEEQILAGLDDWFLTLFQLPDSDPVLQARILKTARLIDPTPIGKRLRNPKLWTSPNSLNELSQEEMERISPQLMHLLSTVARAMGAEAEPWLRKGQALEPNDYWLNVALGYVLNKTEPAQSTGYFRAALAIRPESPTAWYNLGTALQFQHHLSEAGHAYRQALDLDPKHPYAANNLAVVLREQGKFDEAIATIEKSLAIEPNRGDSWYNLGMVYLAQGKLDKAENAFEQTLELDPSHAKAWNNLGSLHLLRNNLTAAVEAQRKAVEADPKFVKAWVNLASNLTKQREFKEAILASQKALDLDPDNALAWSDLGLAYYLHSQLPDAVNAYQKAIHLDPRLPNAHLGLGAVRIEQKRFVEATTALQRACNLLPPTHPFHAYARQHLLLEGAQQSLRTRLPSALEESKESAEELLALADWCLRQKRYRDAVQLYENAFAKSPVLMQERESWVRYDAARAAVLASREDDVEEKERTALRSKALDWLRLEVGLWKDALAKNLGEEDPLEERMRAWKQTEDLTAVREEAARASFPEDERQTWTRLWAEVEQLVE